MLVKLDHFPTFRGENIKKYLKPPHSDDFLEGYPDIHKYLRGGGMFGEKKVEEERVDFEGYIPL